MRKSLKTCISCQHCVVCGGAGFCALKMPCPLTSQAKKAARVNLMTSTCPEWSEDDLLGGEPEPLPDPLASKSEDPTWSELTKSAIYKINTNGPKEWNGWTKQEIAKLQSNPNATAKELAEMLGRSEASVARARQRFGRYRTTKGIALCQKCGEHPVNSQDPLANRWGFCIQCALAEKEYQDRKREEWRRRNDARRQRKCKHNKKDKQNGEQ